MSADHFSILSDRVILDDQEEPSPAAIEIEAGKIVALHTSRRDIDSLQNVVDFEDAVVMAGIVDTHAHLNEPGRTDWEGFETGTQAAAAGGITTLVDMPLNSIPPTTTLAGLKEKAQAAQAKCAIDYGFWGGVIPGNLEELAPMVKAGVMGFKAFLIDSGVDEFPMVKEEDLERAMRALAPLGVPLLVHAELNRNPFDVRPEMGPGKYEHYLHSRPETWEVDAIRLVTRFVRETGCPAHIVHLSAARALSDLARAHRDELPITVETCPHYLHFCAEEIPDGATHFKCAPPIRVAENREALWKGLLDGEIDAIVSDHSPCTPELKKLRFGDFDQAWGGISGLQFSLPAVWTEMRKRKIPIEHLSRWMCAAPAKLAGLAGRKGSLVPGADADLVVWDPDKSFVPGNEAIFHRHDLTPYAEKPLFGVVQCTYLRGACVYEAGEFAATPRGEWVKPWQQR